MAETPEQIGTYSVDREVGRGGMGVVFLGHDTKLDRPVAIKALSDVFADDPERLVRFEREARVLASLSHGNIATVYGFEELEDARYLVMEFVEGETLADRLADGPLPLNEALSVCAQVAAGVEAAHEAGIVHRDLKPGNVIIRPDGTAKVLDFGLAREMPARSSRGSSLAAEATVPPVTQEGSSIGTPGYMSPEQVRGMAVDRRTDNFAFGCILYECLAGRLAFPGQTATDAIAAILEREPDWSALPAHTPPTVQLLLRRCLQKDRRRRLRDIGDARIELEAAIDDPTSTSLGLATAALAAGTTRAGRRRSLAGITAAFAAGIAVTAGALVAFPGVWRSAPAPAPVHRLSAVLPHPSNALSVFLPACDITRDGQLMAYVANIEGTRQVFLRHLDQNGASIVSGTDRGFFPTFSPDGQWIAFAQSDDLRRISIRGGPSTSLCTARQTSGVSWSDDGYVYFTQYQKPDLSRVGENGGEVERVFSLEDDRFPAWPCVLPGGTAILYSSIAGAAGDQERIEVYAQRDGQRRVLVERGTRPLYAASGHLLFVREETLMAAPFDAASLELLATPVPVSEGEVESGFYGSAPVAIAAQGTLCSIPVSGNFIRAGLYAKETSGARTSITTRTAGFNGARYAPDGRRLAVTIGEEQDDEFDVSVWLLDLDNDILTLLTSEPGWQGDPVWSPDGLWIYYAMRPVGGGLFQGLFRRRADGSGAPELIVDGRACGIDSITADGTKLVVEEFPSAVHSPGTSGDIAIIPAEPGAARETWLATEFSDRDPALDPSNTWLAYVSGATDPPQIFVQPFTDEGPRRQVSRDGGHDPFWSPDGRTLYYLNQAEDQVLAVRVLESADGSFQFELAGVALELNAGEEFLDILPDGAGFLVSAEAELEGETLSEIRVTLNIFEELSRIAPVP
jgi:serine/threonine-protein kinase